MEQSAFEHERREHVRRFSEAYPDRQVQDAGTEVGGYAVGQQVHARRYNSDNPALDIRFHGTIVAFIDMVNEMGDREVQAIIRTAAGVRRVQLGLVEASLGEEA
jgi:hypothetical protein